MLSLKQFLSFGLMGAMVLLTGCAASGGNQHHAGRRHT
jgi:hypothetical protein